MRGVAALRLEHHPRRAAHRFDPAGDAHRVVTHGDGAARGDHRLEPGPAEPVDRGARGRSAAPRREAAPCARRCGCPRPRRCRRRRRRHRLAAGSSARTPLHQLRDHRRGEIVGTHAGERAAVPPDRRAHRVQDEDVLAHAPLVASRRRSTGSSSSVGGSVVARSGDTASGQPVAARASSAVDPCGRSPGSARTFRDRARGRRGR